MPMKPRDEFSCMTDDILRVEERRASDKAAQLQSLASRMRQELKRRKKCDQIGRFNFGETKCI